MNIQELINVPRIVFPVGTEVLIKGKIVGLRVLDNMYVENVVRLNYGEQVIAPNDAIYVKNEPEKVKVPQFVAEIIEYYKKQNATLYDALREKNFNKQYNDWLLNEQGAYDKVARAWLFGYEVDEEPKYTVKVKGISENNFLIHDKENECWLFEDNNNENSICTHHTRKELEEAGFGWVFDCPGVQIEEVE